MVKKLRAGILGASGEVGKNYVRLLDGHPDFQVTYVAASANSKGKSYAERTGMTCSIGDLILEDANESWKAVGKCDFIFSAFEADKNLSKKQQEEHIKSIELDYARLGFGVVSNNSAHRGTCNVPMIIPEINSDHFAIIDYQRQHYGFDKGFVVVKPNCNIQSFMIPIHALRKAGYVISDMNLVTLQAISGAPSTTFMDMYDNVRTRIPGEKEKSENEPLKIFGSIHNGEIVNENSLSINAKCNRVPVTDGHSVSVFIKFKNKPSLEQILKIWNDFSSPPQNLKLYSAPSPAIIYTTNPFGPEAKLDRNNGKGMAITVGQLEECKGLFDYSFAGLSHNTIRGAAGGAILTAELLKAQGYLV